MMKVAIQILGGIAVIAASSFGAFKLGYHEGMAQQFPPNYVDTNAVILSTERICHPQPLSNIAPCMERVMALGRRIQELAGVQGYTITLPDGEFKWLNMVSASAIDDGIKIYGARDLTRNNGGWYFQNQTMLEGPGPLFSITGKAAAEIGYFDLRETNCSDNCRLTNQPENEK